MQKLSPIRFGIAIGIAGAVFYLGCIIFMAVTPRESVVWFSNSLLHGADISTVMRESVPWPQSVVGILSTFIGGMLFGSISACIYNAGMGSRNLEGK